MTALIVPWRPSPTRQAAHDFVLGWYAQHLPDAEVFEVDTDHEIFNLGACRNAGAAAAAAAGHDRFVITDADTVPSPSGLIAALADAGDRRLHYPFDQCLYAGTDSRPGLANGGVIVVSAAGWDLIGGQDERFSGWGGEDDQLVAVATCFSGVVRHRGLAVSLWHPAVRDIGSERHRPNAVLAQRYWAAVNDEAQMRALIAER
jgi:hypothetical protein